MTIHTCPPSRCERRERRDVEALRERVQPLLDLGLFRQAVAEVHRHPGWDADPESFQQLGRIMHGFAPHSKDRSCAYSFARLLYRTAAEHTQEVRLRAEALAEIGATYFEEGRLEDAEAAFEQSRALAPHAHHGHLGLLAIACAKRDRAAIRRRCHDLIGGMPRWHRSREAVALLATSPDYAFLRATPDLFAVCLGGPPDELRALHDRYCLQALERALSSFEAGESEEIDDFLENPAVVRLIIAAVTPIVGKIGVTSFQGPLESIEERIGL